jgi:hypothetical protein
MVSSLHSSKLLYAAALIIVVPFCTNLPLIEHVFSPQAQEALYEVSLTKIQNDLDTYLQQAEGELNGNKFRETRQKINLVEQKLDVYKKQLPRPERDRYKSLINTMLTEIDTRIDSLLNLTLTKLKRQGPAAAIEFRRTLSTAYGVSETELARVDEAIVNSGAYDDESRAREEASSRVRVEPEVAAHLPNERTDDPAESERQARAAAERREQERLRAEQERKESLAAAQQHQRQIDQEIARRDRLQQGQAEQERLQQAQVSLEQQREARARQDSLDEVDARIRQIEKDRRREEREQVERQQARAALARKDSLQVVREYQSAARERSRLTLQPAQKSVRESFFQAEPDKAVAMQQRNDSLLKVQSRELPQREEYDANVSRAIETAQKIEKLLAAGSIDEANTVFGIYEPSLRHYLEPTRFKKIQSTTKSRFEALQQKIASTTQLAEKIRSLIDQKRGGEAQAILVENRDDLAWYMDRNAFSELKHAVEVSYQDFSQQRRKALAATVRIRELLETQKAELAYTLFRDSFTHLQNYLEKSEFSDIENVVTDEFRIVQDKRKLADMAEREIRALIKSGRGDDANRRFEQSGADLGQYLTPPAFGALKSAVAQSLLLYTQHQDAGNRMAGVARSFLDQNRPDNAYDYFQKNRDTIKVYLDEPAVFDELQRSVSWAYTELQQKKRWAAQYARSVFVLVEQKQGVEAYDRLYLVRDSLRKFIAPSVLDSLDRATLAARDNYRLNHTIARQKAAQIQNLLAARKAEKAYAQFMQDKKLIDHYLDDDKLFAALVTDVGDAYRLLLQHRQSAAARCRDIERLIEQQEGVRALDLFQSSRAELDEYADAKTVQQLNIAAVKAGKEYQSNKAKAYTRAAEIRRLVEAQKSDQAYTALREQREDLRHYLKSAQAFDSLNTIVNVAYKGLLEKRARANNLQREITALIVRGEGATADAGLEANKAFLARYLDAESFNNLVLDAQRSNNDYLEAKVSAEKTATRIVTLLQQKKVNNAYTLWDENENELQRYLNAAVVKSVKRDVEAQYSILQDKERLSLQQVKEINSFIKQFKGDRAAGVFAGNKSEFQKNLAPETFSDLRDRVTAAYADFTQKRRYSLARADSIKRFLARDSVEKAYLIFRSAGDELKMYLKEKEYMIVSKSVVAPYAALMQRRREAELQLDAINLLIKNNEIVQANRYYYKIQSTLEKNLAAGDYRRADSIILLSTVVFVEQEKRAQEMATMLDKLVSAGLIDSAKTTLRKSRVFLKQFLDERDYARIEKRIIQKYSVMEKERKLARECERQLYRMLTRGEIWPAYRNFRTKRTWLKEYIDKASFEELDQRISMATKQVAPEN